MGRFPFFFLLSLLFFLSFSYPVSVSVSASDFALALWRAKNFGVSRLLLRLGGIVGGIALVYDISQLAINCPPVSYTSYCSNYREYHITDTRCACEFDIIRVAHYRCYLYQYQIPFISYSEKEDTDVKKATGDCRSISYSCSQYMHSICDKLNSSDVAIPAPLPNPNPDLIPVIEDLLKNNQPIDQVGEGEIQPQDIDGDNIIDVWLLPDGSTAVDLPVNTDNLSPTPDTVVIDLPVDASPSDATTGSSDATTGDTATDFPSDTVSDVPSDTSLPNVDVPSETSPVDTSTYGTSDTITANIPSYDSSFELPEKKDIGSLLDRIISNSPLIKILTTARIETLGGTCRVTGSVPFFNTSINVDIDFCRITDILSNLGTAILALAHLYALYLIFRIN
ncbi:MAG: hypothetical protein DSY42_00695 [Aquifex sp.]|nr:MAG: hypothetical protein DSY42_00695 [Aquifex sp.]